MLWAISMENAKPDKDPKFIRKAWVLLLYIFATTPQWRIIVVVDIIIDEIPNDLDQISQLKKRNQSKRSCA